MPPKEESLLGLIDQSLAKGLIKRATRQHLSERLQQLDQIAKNASQGKTSRRAFMRRMTAAYKRIYGDYLIHSFKRGQKKGESANFLYIETDEDSYSWMVCATVIRARTFDYDLHLVGVISRHARERLLQECGSHNIALRAAKTLSLGLMESTWAADGDCGSSFYIVIPIGIAAARKSEAYPVITTFIRADKLDHKKRRIWEHGMEKIKNTPDWNFAIVLDTSWLVGPEKAVK